MLYRARIALESYSNRARIAIVIGPLGATCCITVRYRRIAQYLGQVERDAGGDEGCDDSTGSPGRTERLRLERVTDHNVAVHCDRQRLPYRADLRKITDTRPTATATGVVCLCVCV